MTESEELEELREQMLELEHECVADGINNPKYF